MARRILQLAVAILMIGLAAAEASDSSAPPADPYLRFRPDFARSLPVQILLTGIILTLVAVLFIHLMFTAQYHWPLAPVNYVLQLSGVTTLLISLIATIHVVLSATLAESQLWPYMLNYIAVNVPPPLDNDNSEWSTAERATWLVMNASTSGLIQITHIQFLTLLYPSQLEGRLIFALLGPLAIVAAVMQLVPISDNDKVNVIASAIRNVCNATLSLLFTVALFIWGLLVNRRQAWRTDGGTAAFGAGALALALISTALNFMFVNDEDDFVWLPGLMWAVILWQSFLGWWWWVGAGSGAGLAADDEELEDRLRRKAKRESRRKAQIERRKETKTKARRVWQGVYGVFGTTTATASSEAESSTRPRRSARRRSPIPEDDDIPQPPSPTHSVTSTMTATSAVSFTTLPRSLPRFVHEWYAFIRREHVAAARRQAAERVRRIRELERDGHPAARPTGSGWGLGNFGWRIEPTTESSQDDTTRSRHSRTGSISRLSRRESSPHEDDVELQERPSSSRHKNNRRSRRRGSSISSSNASSNEGDDDGPDHEQSISRPQGPAESSSSRKHLEDEDRRGSLRIAIPPSPPKIRRATATSPPVRSPRRSAASPERPKSIWWWGPLARWRLQDSTTYS